VNTTTQLINPESCIQLMEAFWREQVETAETRDGLALTLPLMYPDGWQVSVFLSATTPGRVQISDQGKTLGTLQAAGMNLEAKATGALLDERLKTFELHRDGLLLTKDLHVPLQGVDVQLFAEALVSIAHLIYRHEPATETENAADKAISRFFGGRGLHPLRNVALRGKVESEIRLDYYLEAKRPLGLEVIRRRGNIRDYIEQWAWRWTDLHAAHPKLIRAMVYDSSVQDITPTIRRIGESVCEVFCPYDEAGELTKLVG
jgi:hypothetical protein